MGARAEKRVVELPAARTRPGRLDWAFPFRIDSRGRTADRGYDEHVRDMIEELLFTSPGERVMRPDFGCGLLDLVFAPNSPEFASALQLSVQAGLQRWLGDVIDIYSLEVISEENLLRVHLVYLVRPTGTQRTDVFERRGTA
ncbi:GPW/gp25 family protein [Crossiella sp. SN42]|uniref:GPW/gp25 family protein n=1 Tax=Crossiella sp. SN42 TaxID=2944808 RepID=UPI00207D5CD0|nr:GPW/gp25 family protein [Crossiella sp. SN42]MCO1577843.1 GPW/gp25 family protein [Crossiella sp. SN42]